MSDPPPVWEVILPMQGRQCFMGISDTLGFVLKVTVLQWTAPLDLPASVSASFPKVPRTLVIP